MRNVLKINALIVVIFSIVLTLFSYKSTDTSRFVKWGETDNSTFLDLRNSNIKGDELFGILSTLTIEDHVNLVKNDYMKVGDVDTHVKSVLIGDQNDNLFQNDQLKTGAFLTESTNNQNLYLSTKNENDAECHGVLFDFLNDDSIQIWTLERYKQIRGSVDGNYIVRSSSNENINKFIRDLSTQTGIDSKTLTQQKTFINVISSPIQSVALIGVIGSLITFMLLGVFYAIQNSKAIGVKKLNGHSNFSIWYGLIGDIIYFTLVVTLIINLIIGFMVKGLSLDFVKTVLLIELIVLLLLVISSLFIYIIIKNNKISNLIKNKKTMKPILTLSYVIHCIVFTLVIVFIVSIVHGLHLVNDQLNKLKVFDSVKEYGVLANFETGNDGDSIAQGSDQLENDFEKYYDYLEKDSNNLYISTEKIVPHVMFKTKYNEADGTLTYVDYFDPTTVPQGYVSTNLLVNHNYLNKYPLYDVHHELIQPSESRMLLIPESKKDQQQTLENIYKSKYIDEVKSHLRKNRKDENVDIDVNFKTVIYQPDPKGYFTFSDEYEKDNYVIKDPIFVVVNQNNMTDIEKGAVIVSGINSPLKINMDKQSSDQYNLNNNAILAKFNLDDNHLKYMSIYELFSSEIQSLKTQANQYMIALVFAFIILILVTVQLVKLLIEANKQKYCVQKLYGYKFKDRYFIMLISRVVLNIVLSMIGCKIISQIISDITLTNITYIFITLMIVIDLIIQIVLIHFFENKNVALLVKGE